MNKLFVCGGFWQNLKTAVHEHYWLPLGRESGQEGYTLRKWLFLEGFTVFVNGCINLKSKSYDNLKKRYSQSIAFGITSHIKECDVKFNKSCHNRLVRIGRRWRCRHWGWPYGLPYIDYPFPLGCYIGVFNMLPNMSQASRRLRQWLLSYNNQNLLCTFGRWKSLPFFEVKLIKTIKITFVLKHLIWSLWFPGFWMWTARLSITIGTKMSLCL